MKSAKKIQESARKGIIQPFTLDLYPITPSGTVSVSKTLEEISDYSIEHPRHVAERDDISVSREEQVGEYRLNIGGVNISSGLKGTSDKK